MWREGEQAAGQQRSRRAAAIYAYRRPLARSEHPGRRRLQFESLERRQLLSATLPGDLFDAASTSVYASADLAGADSSSLGENTGVLAIPRGRAALNPEGTTIVADNGE